MKTATIPAIGSTDLISDGRLVVMKITDFETADLAPNP